MVPEPSRDLQWRQPTGLCTTYNDKRFPLGLNTAQTILLATARLLGVTLRQGAIQPKLTSLASLRACPGLHSTTRDSLAGSVAAGTSAYAGAGEPGMTGE